MQLGGKVYAKQTEDCGVHPPHHHKVSMSLDRSLSIEWPQGSQYHIYFYRVVHLARKADYSDSRDLYL